MAFALRLSLIANIALVGVVGVLLSRTSPGPEKGGAASAVANPSSGQGGSVETSQNRSQASERKLNPSTVAKLEELGISREAVTNMVLEDFNLRSTRELAQLQKKYAPRPVPDREMVEFSRRCEVDRIRELKEKLGQDGYRAWDKGEKLRELNKARPPGNEMELSPSESEQAYALQKDYDEKVQGLQEAMEDGVADRADAGTLEAQAEQALDAGLEKLLGKQRLDELRGNIDPTAAALREYAALDPTQDQASAAAQAEAAYREKQDALTQRLNQNPADSANITAEIKALNDGETEKLRQIFGATAYDEMKLQSDPTYQTLTHYAEAWNLQDSEVQSTYQAIHDFQTTADNIRSAAEMSQAAGQTVNWRQVNSQIEKVQQQTEANLQSLLGGERLRRLKQNGVLTR